jgi:hypothetical protein
MVEKERKKAEGTRQKAKDGTASVDVVHDDVHEDGVPFSTHGW